MQASLEDIHDRLGVGFVLSPYQTNPWSHYDAASGTTCSAEIRMGPDGDEIEAEAQFMYDTPPPGKPPMEQVCYIVVKPTALGTWAVTDLRVRGKSHGRDQSDWESKACVFFSSIVQCLLREELPDIDDLLEEAFRKGRLGDQTGSGGGKSPKIKPAALLGMKKGGGGF